MKEKNKKEEIRDLKETKKFIWIFKEFQKMNKEEQNNFLNFLEGKVEILERNIKNV